MAQRATVVAPAIPIEERAWGRRAQDRVATYALTTPALALLLVFFLVPIYFVVRYSIGLERFAQNEAAASLTGELPGFSMELWREFLDPGLDLEVLGRASVHMPAWVVGVFFAALVFGAVFGPRLSERYGGWIRAGSFLLLLAPFLTIPAGNNLLRVAELSSEGDFLRLFFRSVTMATTSAVWAVIIAFPIAYFLAFGIKKSKYIWLLVVIAPFLTSYLLRIFAWKIILGDQGLFNSALFELGLRDPDNPVSFLIYSQFTVILVLLYAWVPFIILPIFIALETWTGACSRRPPTWARAGSRRCARSLCRSPHPGLSPPSSSSSSRRSASTSRPRSSAATAATCSGRRSPVSSWAARSTGRRAPSSRSSSSASSSSSRSRRRGSCVRAEERRHESGHDRRLHVEQRLDEVDELRHAFLVRRGLLGCSWTCAFAGSNGSMLRISCSSETPLRAATVITS